MLIGLVMAAGPVRAATVQDAIRDVSNSVFVEAGAGQDAAALQEVIADFADRESLVIAVFAGGLVGSPEDSALELVDALAVDTAVVFTPDDVAAASAVHTTQDVDNAFRAAGSAALDRDAAVASRALMEALTDEPLPAWVWLLAVAGVVCLVLGALVLLGRQRRRRAATRDFEQAQAAFRSRLQTVADLILDLDPNVTLANERQMTEDLTRATGIYRDVQWSFDRARTANQVSNLEVAITPAEDILARLAAKVG